MKLAIPTRRHRPGEEEEHAEQQALAVQRPAALLLRLRRVPGKVDPVVHLQVRAVACPQRPLTMAPLSFLQCDSKSTKAKSVRLKPSSTGRGNSSSVRPASSKRRTRIGKVFFRPHSAARANT